jgi:hypothetical protein
MAKRRRNRLVVCIDNKNYPASLEKRKIYLTLSDSVAERLSQLRVVDESGESYLYPKLLFRSITLSQEVTKAVLAAV